MNLLRIQSIFWLVTILTHGAAISLLGVLQSYSEFSSLRNFLNSSSSTTSLITNANNFTFFAPNNAAIQSYIAENPTALTDGSLEAVLQYSLLKGGYPSLSFTDTPRFAASNLVNSTYANVTGGQAAELILGDDGRPQVVSGNRSISNSPSTEIICTGGIVHSVNVALTLPAQVVMEVSEANLEYFISMLNTGGYLNSSNSGYVDGVMDITDVTYFIPNSAIALANFTTFSQNNTSPEELKAVFQYHIVPGALAYSPDLKNGLLLKTQQGDNVNITVQGSNLYVNSAKIISTDHIVANGVLHVIDGLLDRFNKSPPVAPVSSSTASATSTPTPTNVNPSPSASASVTVSPSQTSASNGGLSKGAKIGIGVGVSVAGLLILAALAGFLLRSKKQKRESGIWDNQDPMAGVPNDMGKFYVKRGTIHRQEDLGLGLQSTGMHESRGLDLDETTSPPYSAIPGAQPNIPPRSPSRAIQRNEF